MTTPFGPQLIGETEKALNAILRGVLHDSGLSEAHWVILRLAGQLDQADRTAFVLAVTERAHFPDVAELADQLAARGLLEGGRLTSDGRDLVEALQNAIADTTGPIWSDLSRDDVAAAERVLNEVARRSRHVVATDR